MEFASTAPAVLGTPDAEAQFPIQTLPVNDFRLAVVNVVAAASGPAGESSE
jgi:hypothetical protein